MTIFTKVTDLEVEGGRVLVRADLDVGEEMSGSDTDKLKTILPTIEYLVSRRFKVILVGHRGRPEGKVDGKLSLLPVSERLQQLLTRKIDFIYDISGFEGKEKSLTLKEGEIMMLENLRFDAREEKNDEEFAKSLAEMGDFFVNEAFSASHREHASVVGVPKLLPSVFGLHFSKEIENLSRVFDNPGHPVLAIISGVKKDKLTYIDRFCKFCDKVLVAGRLPDFLTLEMTEESLVDPEVKNTVLQWVDQGKVVLADLVQDKEDITIHSIEKFESEIRGAATVVISGPVGKFEDEGHRQGTKRVLEAIVGNINAFKVAGGGDTEQSIKLLDLADGFDWISIGGGASLDFLANGTLPGIEAIKSRQT